ncbi:MAG: hypothetical protein ACP5KN_21495, partial [Armatimonadota bacterium]
YWNSRVLAYDTQTHRYHRMEPEVPHGGVINDPGVCCIGDTLYVAGAEGPGGTHFDWFRVGTLSLHPEQ